MWQRPDPQVERSVSTSSHRLEEAERLYLARCRLQVHCCEQ